MINYLLVFLILLLPGMILGNDNSDCLECHEETTSEKAVGYDENLALSIHEDFNCIDCHSKLDGVELPHDEEMEKVDCGVCHDGEAEIYQFHGHKKVGDYFDIPGCADCHGKHDIVHPDDKDSNLNPANLSKSCRGCHEDVDLIAKHTALHDKIMDLYENSIHGKIGVGGKYSAATCLDCHSTGGSAHKILGPGKSESSVNHFNIPQTCGQCHKGITRDYWEGIHGQMVANGETSAPVCTDCHGEHGIVRADDPDSRVSSARVAEATCTPCHESARLNERYGVTGTTVTSRVDSYHGLKSQAGDKTVANCASCHGAHRILPHTDPSASIYHANLAETCGHCHEDITEQMATTTRIHGEPGVTENRLADIVGNIYIILIILVIGGMLLHWLIDFLREVKQVMNKPQYKRMTTNETLQHYFLMISFIVLVLTGFSLRFSDAFWVQWLFGWEGGFPLRGLIHRISAVIMMVSTVWHVIYLLSPRGKQFFKDMLPDKTDWNHLVQLVSFNLGISKNKPRFGRFVYIEKVEYWALIWGTAVMIVTGLLLWMDNLALSWISKSLLDVILVIHYYEAWLATLAILVWHLYSTVFNPGIYPMNPAWINGKMPIEMYKHEHPEDPAVKDIDKEV